MPTSLPLAIVQVGIITGVSLILSGCLAWLFYARETSLSLDRRKAEDRGLALQRQLLTYEQRSQLSTCGFLELASRLISGRTYRIPRRRAQIQIYEHGKHAGSLCIQPTRWVPDSDLVLIHKTMIEGSEDEYLRIANFFKPYRAA